jgi:hypothetical protein
MLIAVGTTLWVICPTSSIILWEIHIHEADESDKRDKRYKTYKRDKSYKTGFRRYCGMSCDQSILTDFERLAACGCTIRQGVAKIHKRRPACEPPIIARHCPTS